MRTWFCRNKVFVFCLLVSIELIGQEVSTNFDHSYVLAGFGVPIEVFSKKELCDSLIICAAVGRVKRGDAYSGKCWFLYHANKVGLDSIFICKQIGQDTLTLEKIPVVVAPWPEHKARFAGSEEFSGTLKVKRSRLFDFSTGLYVPIQVDECSGYLKIAGFKLLIVREGELIFETINYGGRFMKSTLHGLKEVLVGDKIVLKEIKVKMPGEENERELNEIIVEVY
ncbi:MAG: hypothetical protein KDC44_13040 [Phaeodactylibacter sp.]|nr:hypothetical protein [Phaeodactylibacter sp.]